MDKIVIEGGRPLEGTVTISGAKNAVLPVLAATLLTRGRNIIEGVPKVRDVATMIQLLKDLGPAPTTRKRLMIWFPRC
jgi:UDP-N-acetylglucosamine 1-carboxyvinyltransferase